MVVWDLREKMMNDMSANVMVDVVDPPIVPVHGRQATTEVAPFLHKWALSSDDMIKPWLSQTVSAAGNVKFNQQKGA